MNIVILGSKVHPATLQILAEFHMRGIPIKALIQKRQISYPPGLVFQYLSTGGADSNKGGVFSKRILNLENLKLAIHNPGFALGFLKCLFLTKTRPRSKNMPQYTHQYTSKSQLPRVNLSNLCIYNVDNFNSRRAERLLRQIEPDLLISGPAAQILRTNILRIPRLGTLNSHPGMLPKYRGVHPIEYAILNGDSPGVTTYFVDSGVDTGDIILSRCLKLAKGMTIEDIESQTRALVVETLADAVQMIASSKYERRPQDLSAGTHYYSIHQSLRELAQQSLRRIYGAETVEHRI